jgi:hypothetical protein
MVSGEPDSVPQGWDYPLSVTQVPTKLWFTEEMKGFWEAGETDFSAGASQGQAAGSDLMFHLTITIDGVHDFATRPEHDTSDLAGYVQSREFGGQCPVEQGTFNLFVDAADPSLKHMLYRLFFTDKGGKPLTLSGTKIIRDDPQSDVWRATTTLYTRILKGHVTKEEEDALAKDPKGFAAISIGAGIMIIHMLDFVKQLSSFRAEAPTLAERITAFTEFGRLFFGKLWDVYAREILTSGPV